MMHRRLRLTESPSASIVGNTCTAASASPSSLAE